jgi:thiol:disulfide interchange protein DsbD
MRSRRPLLIPLLAAAAASLALPATAEAGIFDGLDESFTAALESGNWAVALPLIYLVGLATALTPCVYPMIVITVSVFGARQAKTKTEGALLSTSFVAGMVSLFTPLGVIVPLTGAAFGSWLTHPAVVIGFAVLFSAMALAMFGAWEMNLPPALQNKLGQVGGIGLKGAFGLGAASALIAAPCTGPALVGLLAWIATTGDVGLGAICMATYALGLGTLFWLVGTFAVSLPKSGRWMEMVKSVFGIVLLVMALYYLRLLVPAVMDWLSEHATEALAVGVVLVLAGLGLGAVHLDFHEPSTPVRVRKGTGIALSTTGGALFTSWLVAVPPIPAGAAAIEWREDFEPAIAEARAAGRPYMIDFGADWCGACGELERHTFTDPAVAAEAARFVNIHVDMSASTVTPASRALLASYEQRGLPLVVLHDHEGTEVHRVTEFVEPGELLALLRDVE